MDNRSKKIWRFNNFNEFSNSNKVSFILFIFNYKTIIFVTRKGKVSNRTIVIREIMPDASLAFTAQACSKKIKDIVSFT